jgi:hypothetical protein
MTNAVMSGLSLCQFKFSMDSGSLPPVQKRDSLFGCMEEKTEPGPAIAGLGEGTSAPVCSKNFRKNISGKR